MSTPPPELQLNTDHIAEISGIFDINIKEAQIYLLLLKFGALTSNMIRHKLDANRSAINGQLERLCNKGLVVKHPNSEANSYSAIDPEKLNILLHEESIKLCQKKKRLEFIGNELINTSRYTPKKDEETPKIDHYKGAEQCQRAMRELIYCAKDQILGYCNVSNRNIGLFKSFWKTYYKERISRGIEMLQISPDNDVCREHKKNDSLENRITLLVPEKNFKYPESCELSILHDRFAITNLNEMNSEITVIKDVQSTLGMREIFLNHWNYLLKDQKLY